SCRSDIKFKGVSGLTHVRLNHQYFTPAGMNVAATAPTSNSPGGSNQQIPAPPTGETPAPPTTVMGGGAAFPDPATQPEAPVFNAENPPPQAAPFGGPAPEHIYWQYPSAYPGFCRGGWGVGIVAGGVGAGGITSQDTPLPPLSALQVMDPHPMRPHGLPIMVTDITAPPATDGGHRGRRHHGPGHHGPPHRRPPFGDWRGHHALPPFPPPHHWGPPPPPPHFPPPPFGAPPPPFFGATFYAPDHDCPICNAEGGAAAASSPADGMEEDESSGTSDSSEASEESEMYELHDILAGASLASLPLGVAPMHMPRPPFGSHFTAGVGAFPYPHQGGGFARGAHGQGNGPTSSSYASASSSGGKERGASHQEATSSESLKRMRQESPPRGMES
ncbi:hypothetical protein KFL_001730010, partial [Klebsormidium nitens]